MHFPALAARRCRRSAVGLLAALLAPAVVAAGFGPSDFLRADGPVIRAASGAVVTLHGTNLGGWFMFEPWMCPTGRGLVRRRDWRATVAGRPAPAVLDGRAETSVTLAPDAPALELDFPRWTTFEAVAVRSNAAATWAVSLSNDGTTWRAAPVATAKRGGDETVLTLAAPSTARALRLRLVSHAAAAVSEVNLEQGDDATLQTTLADRFGASDAARLLRAYQDAWITGSDLDAIAGWGLNLVRVPINWRQFLAGDGTWRPDAWTKLDWLLAECDRRRIYVILDLHAVPGGASPWASSGHAGDDGTGHNPNGFWDDPRCLDRAARIWQAIAERYRGRAVVAGYDLINEPLVRYDERPNPGELYSTAVRQKSAAMDRLYRTVRAVDPEHMIFIASFGVTPPGLPPGTPHSVFDGMTPPAFHGWTNVVYETHHYDMDHAGDRAAQLRLVTTAIQDLAEHQRAWNVPVYAGEYSLYGFYDVWAQWMAGLNDRHISWSSWTYKVRGGADEPGGRNWGFYYGDSVAAPDVMHDPADRIARRWAQAGTAHFIRNTPLIDVVRRYASGR